MTKLDTPEDELVSRMVEALKSCLKCFQMDSDMQEDFAPEIKRIKSILTEVEQ